MERRVFIQWTTTAKNQLAALPTKARRGLLTKADGLAEVDDPRKGAKPLAGLLQGYYRIRYGRYRAIFQCSREKLANGDVWIHVRVRFVAVGKREAGGRADVYRIADKLINRLGLDTTDESED